MTAGTDAASLAKEEFEDLESTQPTVLGMMCFWVFLGAAIRSLPLSNQRHIPCTVFVLVAGLGLGWVGSECTLPLNTYAESILGKNCICTTE